MFAQLIELWETFLLQLDAEDNEIGQAYTAASSLPGSGDGVAAAVEGSARSKDNIPEDSAGAVGAGVSQAATATDVALEQDA